jgi:hypothetical protein
LRNSRLQCVPNSYDVFTFILKMTF